MSDSRAPQITTIIPTFRRPQFLHRAIASVLAQTYPNFKVRIYDNASGDETKDIVAQFTASDPRVSYFCHPTSLGTGQRNFAYAQREIDTPYFSFLSDDDVVLPQFFETALAALERRENVMFAAGSTFEMTPTGEVLLITLSDWPREGVYEPPDALFQMLRGDHPCWPAVLFRTRVIEEVGLLAADCTIQDLEYELRVAARFPVYVTRKPCGIFTRHAAGITANMDAGWLEDYADLARRFAAEPVLDPRARRAVSNALASLAARRAVELAATALMRGDYAAARDAARFVGSRLHRPALAASMSLGAAACRVFPPLKGVVRSIASVVASIRRQSSVNRFRARAAPGVTREISGYRSYLDLPALQR
ncbi:MAG: glycosyltransferase family 2 protein [Candidatus Eremiobacteraeota bacterium]|nr:glycosyltransferase family 2 protein [Candidatus Eremiobacteraeota bacterium]MBV8366913.1 glycosyltransferase family 2 protein [Candidatus Eremiobacteraeota bacterium]